MFGFRATFLVYPGREQEAARILREYMTRTKNVPGILTTSVSGSQTEARRFYLDQELTNLEAFDLLRESFDGYLLPALAGIVEPASLIKDTFDLLTPRDVQEP
jgi:hypothetical protein